MTGRRRSPAINLNPFKLAEEQLKRDRTRVRIFGLLARKIERMQASPLGFLRGSAPLFYEILKRRPALTEGPGGEGWITGDLHLENFGAYRAESTAAHGLGSEVVFNVNDFDEAIIGPWRFDVLRLMTSLLIVARDLGLSGTTTLSLCHSLLDAHALGAAKGVRPGKPPPVIRRLLQQARRRTREELLDARTKMVKGVRRFIRGDRYRDLPRVLKRRAAEAFERCAWTLGPPRDAPANALEILDLAFRVAGIGSLGTLRVAVLVSGWGGKNGCWLFEMKEQGTPAASVLLRRPAMDPGLRVVTAQRACLEKPPRMIGVAHLGTRSMSVRRLAPQEDKLDLRQAKPEELDGLAHYLGEIVGAVHRRGAKSVARPWSRKDRSPLIDHAVALAGLYQAIYLSFCRLTHRTPSPSGRGSG